MALMNARQAKADTKEVIATRVEDALETVEKAILAAIKEGEYQCVVMDDIPRSVRTMLSGCGYAVSKYVDATREPVLQGWKISWEDD